MQATDQSRLHRNYVDCNMVNKDYCSVTNCNISGPNKRVSSRISYNQNPKTETEPSEDRMETIYRARKTEKLHGK